MKKFAGIMIGTDLDGTLLKNDKSISKENVEAIEYFKSEGGIFTFITGRMPLAARPVYKMLDVNAPFGCINGGGIFDHKEEKLLWYATISNSVVEMLEEIDKKVPTMGIQLNTPEKIYFCKDSGALKRFREQTGVGMLTCDYHGFNEPIAKILFSEDSEENILKVKELLDAHPRASEFDFIRSGEEYYEILPKGENKGTVLLRIAELIGIDKSKIIGVGDHDNDADLLKSAAIGFAVANASPLAKEAADYITVSNEEHAIAKIIGDLDDGKISFR